MAGPQTQSLKTILAASAEEISSLRGLAVKLQSVTFEFSDADSETLNTVQSLDYIQQSLTELSKVLSQASEKASQEWTLESLDTVSGVTLTTLRKRMQGLTESGKSTDISSSGNCDLF